MTQTTVDSNDFEWLTVRCEGCGILIALWKRIPRKPEDFEVRGVWVEWGKRRFCSLCAFYRFSKRRG